MAAMDAFARAPTASQDYPRTWSDFMDAFSTEEACARYLERLRWPEGFVCAKFELLPGVHRIAALMQRWILGTHHGAVQPAHLDDYLNEFVFRFNRRTSRSRGLLFYRLMQQAVITDPVIYTNLIRPTPIVHFHG
jgi:hypothetical protein